MAHKDGTDTFNLCSFVWPSIQRPPLYVPGFRQPNELDNQWQLDLFLVLIFPGAREIFVRWPAIFLLSKGRMRTHFFSLQPTHYFRLQFTGEKKVDTQIDEYIDFVQGLLDPPSKTSSEPGIVTFINGRKAPRESQFWDEPICIRVFDIIDGCFRFIDLNLFILIFN